MRAYRALHWKRKKAFAKGYPAVYEHLLAFKEPLSQRNQEETGIRYEWYALQRCAATYYEAFDKPKLVYRDIALNGEFVWDETGMYVDMTAFIIPARSKALLGMLNSKLFTYMMGQVSSSIQGGFYRWKSQYMSVIPYVAPPPLFRVQLEQLVDRRLAMDPGPAATSLESEIDVLVSKLYGLSWEQAKVVDPGMALSKAEYDAIELPPNDEPSGGTQAKEPGVNYIRDHGEIPFE
jgi:hypothetical protein